MSRSKTSVLGGTSTGEFLCIHRIISLAVDGDYDNVNLLGMSASAQDRRRSEEGEAIALSQVRLRQDI